MVNVRPEREALVALVCQSDERRKGLPENIASVDCFIAHQQIYIWGVSVADMPFPFGFDPDILLLGEVPPKSDPVIPEHHEPQGCGCAVLCRKATDEEQKKWNKSNPTGNSALYCYEALKVAAASGGTIYFTKTGDKIFCTSV